MSAIITRVVVPDITGEGMGSLQGIRFAGWEWEFGGDSILFQELILRARKSIDGMVEITIEAVK